VIVLHALFSIVGLAALTAAAGFSGTALLAVVIWRACFAGKRRNFPLQPAAPVGAVTILKPLCGAEPGLYTHLRSFCQQQYPLFQIVFGVRDAADPALGVVKRIVAEFPSVAIDVVVDAQLHGDNYKTSNLINMMSRARYGIFVIADSDAVVGPDYLSVVSAPLLEREVGLVTCVYRGAPTETVWSRLGAMYVNDWFIPSVLVAWLFGHRQFASGQTLCIRRDTLQAIGGLQALANHIADDFRLGELVRGVGQRIVLSTYEVEAEHHEPSADALLSHELRWMRTLQAVRPASFRWMFLTFTLPLALVGVLFASAGIGAVGVAWSLFAITSVSRLALHFTQRLYGRGRPMFSDLWLVPARDLLLCWAWGRSFSASSITWRGSEFEVDDRGVMRRLA
jgi:ceramide glucosyltransferase